MEHTITDLFLVICGLLLGVVMYAGFVFVVSRILLVMSRMVLGEKWGTFEATVWMVLCFSIILGDGFALTVRDMGLDWTAYAVAGLMSIPMLTGFLLAMRPYTTRRFMTYTTLIFPVPAILWVSFSPWIGVIKAARGLFP